MEKCFFCAFYADFMHVLYLMRVLLAKFYEPFLNTFVDSAYVYSVLDKAAHPTTWFLITSN